MKKTIIFFIFVCILISGCFGEKKSDFADFDKIEIQKELYSFSNNSNLYLFYKTKEINEVTVISEAYYVLYKNSQEYKVIGGFNLKQSFFDSNGQKISKKRNLDVNNEFWKTNLKGFSMKTLDDPFVIFGIAIDSNGNMIETEVIEMLEIDSDTLNLKEWHPVW